MTDTLKDSSADDSDQAIAERAARAMQDRDRVTPSHGMVLDKVGRGTAEMSMTVREEMLNGFDTCHGGYIFMLADSTFAFACNSRNQVAFLVSADISYIKPVQLGETLKATAREISLEGRNGIYDVEVRNAAGDMVAHLLAKSRIVRGEVTDTPNVNGGNR